MLRNFIIFDQFQHNEQTEETQTKTFLAALLYFLYFFSADVVLISNYYVFYHLVKKYFESKNEEDHMNSNDLFLIHMNS